MADEKGLGFQCALADQPDPRALDIGALPWTLGFRLRLAQQYVFREFLRRFNALDISPVTYSPLVLIEKNQPCRQIELAAALGVRQPNLVERIDALVQRGLVSRGPDPEDRRANILKITPAGKRFMIRVPAVHDEHNRQLMNQLGEDDYNKLIELLGKLR